MKFNLELSGEFTFHTGGYFSNCKFYPNLSQEDKEELTKFIESKNAARHSAHWTLRVGAWLKNNLGFRSRQ